MATNELPAMPRGEIIVYEAPDGEGRVDVRFNHDSVWLTQRQMAEVFETSADNVSLHLRRIYATDELGEAATAEDFSVIRSEGVEQQPGPGALTALTLLIAESAPSNKDLMIRLIVNLIGRPGP